MDYIVSGNTGEVIGEFPIGAVIRTPEQIQATRKHFKELEQKKERDAQLKELGKFIFMSCEKGLDNIQPETVARLVFLSTYLQTDDNVLAISKMRKIYKKDLPSVMGLSRQTVAEFIERAEQYITVQEDGLVRMTGQFFIRGKLGRTNGTFYQMAHINAVRRLYRGTAVNKHRYLGYVFAMLPYINYEFNILCENPDEIDIDHVIPLSFSGFCDLISYDKTKMSRLRKTYSDITFGIGEKKERFLSVVYDGAHKETERIFVNPHVIYCGSNYKRVEILGYFCTETRQVST